MIESWVFAVSFVVGFVAIVYALVRGYNSAADSRDARRRNQAHPWRTRDSVRRRR